MTTCIYTTRVSDAAQKEITVLSATLKRTVLDRDRPFQRTPLTVQSLFFTLLKLEKLLNGADTELIQQTRVRRTLTVLLDSPSLQVLPSVLQLAECLLFRISLAAVTNSPQPQDYASVCAANDDILEFRPMQSCSSEQLTEDYIGAPLLPHVLSDEITLGRLLGVVLTTRTSPQTRRVHLSRAKDIIGPNMKVQIDM